MRPLPCAAGAQQIRYFRSVGATTVLPNFFCVLQILYNHFLVIVYSSFADLVSYEGREERFSSHKTQQAQLSSPMEPNKTCVEGVIVSSNDTFDFSTMQELYVQTVYNIVH